MGTPWPDPILLLLHGLLNDERVWEPVAAPLRAEADIRIPKLRRQQSIAQMARDAWALVADVSADVPVVLAGFSMGGYVAIQMLAEPARRQLRAIIGRADHRALLAKLDIPTRVLCGRTDQVTPLELSQEAAALIPNARLVIVDQAGHWAPLEQPQIVGAELRRLLAAL